MLVELFDGMLGAPFLVGEVMLFRKLNFSVAGNESQSEHWHPERALSLFLTGVISHLHSQPGVVSRPVPATS